MGRGRAKAKQTKVARELKYRPMDMDISSLEQELRGDGGQHVPPAYEDLAAEYDQGSDSDSDGYGDLRKSG
ncbi:DUF3073 domain-containing protein [Microlunatus parietis]|uniref:DUF3073 domain-containing protein n=1 Tax=Microlunatus parietis TaxID=682979 RepID=A0A7Y9LEB1_9ACTN|nr:DUF3073 domain-containing protein [Microlunatus parietis]NYE72871.1 hypothetical protein [Microlunatus parietis]